MCKELWSIGGILSVCWEAKREMGMYVNMRILIICILI